MSCELPTHTRSAKQGEKGVRMVTNIIEDVFEWIFRPIYKSDIGIDGEIEILDGMGRPTGELLAVQIKCGGSYFIKKGELGYIFYASKKEVNYWQSLLLPVVLCLCNPDEDIIYWTHISLSTIFKTEKGYKIIVPFENKLNKKNEFNLRAIIDTIPKITDIVDLSIFKYLYNRYDNNISINPDICTPRDFYRLSYMMTLYNEIYLVGKIINKYGEFDVREVSELIKIFDYNVKATGNNRGDFKFLICFVSEIRQALKLSHEIEELLAEFVDEIDYDRLVFNRSLLSCDFINVDGREIYFFNSDGTIDEGRIFDDCKFDDLEI